MYEDSSEVSESEVERQAHDLFHYTPIKFLPEADKASPNYKIDAEIQKCIANDGITIPIVHIKDYLYLIGPKRVQLDWRNDVELTVVDPDSGIQQNLNSFMATNEFDFKKELVRLMLRSDESLEYIVDQLIQNKEIKDVHK